MVENKVGDNSRNLVHSYQFSIPAFLSFVSILSYTIYTIYVLSVSLMGYPFFTNPGGPDNITTFFFETFNSTAWLLLFSGVFALSSAFMFTIKKYSDHHVRKMVLIAGSALFSLSILTPFFPQIMSIFYPSSGALQGYQLYYYYRAMAMLYLGFMWMTMYLGPLLMASAQFNRIRGIIAACSTTLMGIVLAVFYQFLSKHFVSAPFVTQLFPNLIQNVAQNQMRLASITPLTTNLLVFLSALLMAFAFIPMFRHVKV